MAPSELELASPSDVGSLGVYQLKRLWARTMLTRRGRKLAGPAETNLDYLVIHALGLGLEPTLQYLFKTGPTFEEFEDWVAATAGAPEPALVARINAMVTGSPVPPETQRKLDAIAAAEPALTADDLAFWEREGYVIVHDAISPAERAAAEQLVWEEVGAKPEDPETWYFENPHGIMVQRFQHPALTANRQSARIHKAFAQLWGTPDLWITTDRIGFNPPERADHPYRGTPMHWDTSVHLPIPFGTQGILYLTDTPAEQGAFTCVPGFQHRIESWLASLPPGADPRQQNLPALGAKPIAGRAGDLIIWNQALPHCSSPNHGTRPRLVHYINLFPAGLPDQTVWR